MNEAQSPLSELTTMLSIAEQAVREAGRFLIQTVGNAHVHAQKSSHDDLLDVDLQAERIILTMLREHSPQTGTLSEEAGHEGNDTHYWVVDPLDGSANFQHGSPLFAISVALIENHTTSLGMIYIPSSNEMFTAVHNQGAYFNGSRINVSHIDSLENAIVHSGDIMKEGNAELSRQRLKELSPLIARVRRIRMLGTAAIDLAYIACGRADGLINYAKHSWDIEAGKLLLLEAGGKVTHRQREDQTIVSIYSNGALHQKLEDVFLEQSE